MSGFSSLPGEVCPPGREEISRTGLDIRCGIMVCSHSVERVTSFLAALLLIHDALLFFLHFLQTLHEV